MAHYSFRRNKDGAITSVRICIHTDNGQINTSYKPEFDDMPEDYIMLKARSYGDAMEGNIKFGTYLSPSTLFSDAAEYFIALGRSFGNTAKTERYYRTLLVRVKDPVYGFGNMPIGKITTGTINTFIMNLSQSENKHSACVRCTVDIDKFLKNHHISVYSFAKKAGTSEDVIRRIRKGKNITLTSAEKICSVYGNNLESMFILTDPGKLSTTFLNDHINFIRSVFSLAVREHVIFFNPCDPVRRFKSSTTKKTGALSMDQIKRIFECLKEEDNLEMVLFTFLLIFTGARRGEILGLKWENIDLETGEIYLCNSLQYTPENGVYEGPLKTGRNRTVFIEKVIADILKQWKAVQDKQRRQFRSIWKDDGYVFTGEFGGHLFPDTPNGWLDDFADKYGFPHIHPHMFRHTHASILIACGEDIATVSQRLGHTSINTTTKIYLHSFSENDRSASLLFTKAVMPDEINIKEYFRQ